MFADRSNHNHNHPLRDDGDELDTLTPATQDLHARLLEDGATFRAGLPDVSDITRRALLLVAPSAPPELGNDLDSQSEEQPAGHRHTASPGLMEPRHPVRRLPAIAAALVIVGMLAALFATFAPGRIGGPPSHPHPSAHRLTGSTWTKVPIPYSSGAGAEYIVAPGDPRVVYYIGVSFDDTTNTASELFARLDNGQRWVPLSIPLPNIADIPTAPAGYSGFATQKGIGYRLDVMPNNPMALILNLEVDGTSRCPIAHPVSFTGVTCDEYLYSSDGGAHWRSLRLPGPGLLALQLALDDGTRYQPYWNQDGRLYTTLSTEEVGYVPTGVRIVSSTDNGASWQYADGDLTTQGKRVYEFVPIAHGTTLYAVTRDATYTGPDAGPRQLWRSNDAGATWMLAGHMPDQTELIGVADSTTRATPVLYRDQQVAGDGSTRADLSMLLKPEVSVDGGRTWARIPFAGLPTNTGGTPYTVGTLSDGSVVAVLPGKTWREYGSGNAAATLTFYAWAPGDTTWRRLTPTANLEVEDSPLSSVPGWWLIPNTPSTAEQLCVSGSGGDINTTWGVACTTLT